MKIMKLWRTMMCLLLITAMLMSFGACGCSNQKAGEFSLNCYALTLEEGHSAKIVSSVDAARLTWVSSNPAVATVNNGTVTAIQAGTAEITAVSATDKAICRVTVTEKVSSVPALSVASDNVTLFIGKQFDLQPAFKLNGESVDTANYTITYSVDAANVVSVSAGIVTALDVGTTEITVSLTYGNTFYQKKIAVTVRDAENYLVLEANKMALCYGKTVSGADNVLQTAADFSYTMYLDGIAQPGKSEGITFTSSNESVATVSSTGKVTATGIGYADITAAFRGETYTVSVTVGTPIATVADLNALSNAYRDAEDQTKAPDLWDSGRIYVLAKDIDFAGASFFAIAAYCDRGNDADGRWMSTSYKQLNKTTGSSPYSFAGVINGGGHEIKNMILAPVWAQWNNAFYSGANFIGHLSGRLENIAFTNLVIGNNVSDAVQHCGLINTMKDGASLDSVYVDVKVNAGMFASKGGLLAYGWDYNSGIGNDISVHNCVVKAHYADAWQPVDTYGQQSSKLGAFIYAPNSNKPANISGCYFISDNMTEDLLYGSAVYIGHIYSSLKELVNEKTELDLKNEGFDKPMIDRIMSAK